VCQGQSSSINVKVLLLTKIGYWMPYEAAKAIAATFCWNIRWALTPVFGNHFPSLCLPPNHPSYAKFLIDSDIVHQCTDETNRFRIEGSSYRIAASKLLTETYTPKIEFSSPPWGTKDVKTAHPRTSEEESGYCTESDYSEKCLCSPQVSPRSTMWTSVNQLQSPTPSSVFASPGSSLADMYPPPSHQILPTSMPDRYYDEPLRTKRTYSRVTIGYHDQDTANDVRQSPTELASSHVCSDAEMEDCGDGIHTLKELNAAEIMMQMSAADGALPPTKRTRRGSYC
jgi:hypothetical protein